MRIYGTSKWRALRDRVLERDGWICQLCGCGEWWRVYGVGGPVLLKRTLHAHHRIPRSVGGDDSIDNLITLCSSCHKTAEVEAANTLTLGDLVGLAQFDEPPPAEPRLPNVIKPRTSEKRRKPPRLWFSDPGPRKTKPVAPPEVTPELRFWLALGSAILAGRDLAQNQPLGPRITYLDGP